MTPWNPASSTSLSAMDSARVKQDRSSCTVSLRQQGAIAAPCLAMTFLSQHIACHVT
ncbi:hypothetical protein KCP71_15885 [Salmonella enterica subsp. enterica]|nr:hypothetical protein KCP71_15885 [Salmonella enterica subsp. enterica]